MTPKKKVTLAEQIAKGIARLLQKESAFDEAWASFLERLKPQVYEQWATYRMERNVLEPLSKTLENGLDAEAIRDAIVTNDETFEVLVELRNRFRQQQKEAEERLTQAREQVAETTTPPGTMGPEPLAVQPEGGGTN